MEIINVLAFIGLSIISLVLFTLGFKLLRSDNSIYQSNRSYNKSIIAALKGQCEPQVNARDFKCAAGMAYDKKSGKIVFQGKLSHEAVQDVLR